LDPTVEWVQVDVPNMGEPEKEEVKKEEKKEKEETNVADYYASMIGISGNSVTSYMKGPLLIQETREEKPKKADEEKPKKEPSKHNARYNPNSTIQRNAELISQSIENTPGDNKTVAFEYITWLLNEDLSEIHTEVLKNRFIPFMTKHNLGCVPRNVVNFWRKDPKIADLLFEHKTVNNVVRDEQSHFNNYFTRLVGACTPGDLPIYRRLLKFVSNLKFEPRLPIEATFLILRRKEFLLEHFVNTLIGLNVTVGKDSLMELFTYNLSTDELYPIFPLVGWSKAGILAMLCGHVSPHGDLGKFLDTVSNAVKHGFYKANPSELVPLLVSRMNSKFEFDQVLDAMKKFPMAAPELLNDASLAVMMASEHQDVLEKIKEYRTHY